MTKGIIKPGQSRTEDGYYIDDYDNLYIEDKNGKRKYAKDEWKHDLLGIFGLFSMAIFITFIFKFIIECSI